MRRFFKALLACIFIFTAIAFARDDLKIEASHYEASSAKATRGNHFAADSKKVASRYSPRQESSYSSGIYSAQLYSGSLKENVTRIAHQYGWNKVIWSLPHDYQWVGDTRVTADSVSGLFGKFLANYPLQAVFYKGNHVLLIQPRTLR